MAEVKKIGTRQCTALPTFDFTHFYPERQKSPRSRSPKRTRREENPVNTHYRLQIRRVVPLTGSTTFSCLSGDLHYFDLKFPAQCFLDPSKD